MRRVALVVVAVMFPGLVLVGCHGGSPAPTQPTSPPSPAATIVSLSIAGPACADGVCGGAIGATVQLAATAQFSDGTSHDVTSRAQWSSTNADVASVGASGLVSFRAAGDAEIAAAYQGAGARQPVHAITCGYAPESVAAFNAIGGSASVSVGTAPSCRWSAATADAWIRIASSGPSSGPLGVAFTVDPNRSFTARSGAIAIRGEHGDTLALYAVTQRSAGCLYTTDAALALTWMGTYDGAGDGPVAVRVHAEPADCQWTATPSVSWARVVYGSGRGTGSGIIYVSVIEWNAGPARTADIRIAGLSGVNPDAHVAVTQGGR